MAGDDNKQQLDTEAVIQQSLANSFAKGKKLFQNIKELVADIDQKLGAPAKDAPTPASRLSEEEFETRHADRVKQAQGIVSDAIRGLDEKEKSLPPIGGGPADAETLLQQSLNQSSDKAKALQGEIKGLIKDIDKNLQQPAKDEPGFRVGAAAPANVADEREKAAGTMLRNMDGFMGAGQRDGFVTEKEFKAMMPAKGDIAELKNTLDLDRDGTVEKHELEASLKASGLSGLDKMGLDAAVKGLGSMLLKNGVDVKVGDTSTQPQSSKLNVGQEQAPTKGAGR